MSSTNATKTNLANQILDDSNTLIDRFDQCSIKIQTENNAPSLFSNSLYIENKDYKNLLYTNKNIFNLISLNCQSLTAKYDEIKHFIETRHSDQIQKSTVCLQETWFTQDNYLSLFHIKGYNLISRCRSCSAHGEGSRTLST